MDETIDWIINNQLGRRNVTEIQKSYLRGLQYEREKKKATGRSRSGGVLYQITTQQKKLPLI
jgi:hypothetical protein